MASLPPTGSSLAFNDARGCKEWLGTLPLTNIPQAQALLLDMLRALNGAEFDPLERLKCLELARERVAFLQGEQRSRSGSGAAWRCGGPHTGVGKCASSRKRGITCQCTCGVMFPRLATFILSGDIASRTASSTANTTPISRARSAGARSVSSRAWRPRITRQNPG
jgi:hypothetical protein